MKTLKSCAAILLLVLTSCSSPSSDGSTIADRSLQREWNYATNAQVLQAVEAAQSVQKLPEKVAATLNDKDSDEAYSCSDPQEKQTTVKADFFGECTYGDPQGAKLAIVYGDSAAPMWSAALELIALKRGWKLKMYSLGGCSIADLHFMSSQTNSPNTECDAFRAAATPVIRDQHPDLVIVFGLSAAKLADGSDASSSQLQEGWASAFESLAQPGTRLAVVEPIPMWKTNDPRCLAAHLDDMQACSADPQELFDHGSAAPQQAAAAAAQGAWVPTQPWVCAARCEPVVADIRVYRDNYHFTRTYVVYLTGALDEALQPVMA